VKILPEMFRGQGRTDYILERIRVWMRIWEFLKGFYNIARWDSFHSSAHISGKTDMTFMKTFHRSIFGQRSLHQI